MKEKKVLGFILIVITIFSSCTLKNPTSYNNVKKSAIYSSRALTYTPPVPQPHNHGANQYGDTIGYEATAYVHSSTAYIVSTSHKLYSVEEQFQRAIDDASITEIYLNSDVEINMSDLAIDNPIRINRSLTIASSRTNKENSGALIHINSRRERVFLVTADNVTFSGLRIRGPEGGHGIDPAPNNNSNLSIGILAENCSDLTVENCELFNWDYAAVRLRTATGLVKQCYIHNNRQLGWGYGTVVALGGNLIAEGNEYRNNRHCIAGAGDTGDSYTACFNKIEEEDLEHSFDMHGANGDIGPNAGKVVKIYNNSFNDSSEVAIIIRGIPSDSCKIEYNYFEHYYEDRAIRQRFNFGKLIVGVNSFNTSAPATKGYYVSWAGKSPWYRIYSSNVPNERIDFGDFDGNDTLDVFYADGSDWKKLEFKPKYGIVESGAWEYLNAGKSEELFDANGNKSLLLGDFDGNGTTDVFSATGSLWRFCWNGEGGWSSFLRSVPITELAIGNFDGNSTDDFLRVYNGQWYLSSSYNGSLNHINSLNVPLSSLAFGDFNGDGNCDVFTTEAQTNYWSFSWSANTSWDSIGRSVPMTQLAYGDFDGNSDSKDDLLRVYNGVWYLNSGHYGTLTEINRSSVSLDKLRFADFDRDGKMDVFTIGTNL